jgi:hypothetical protein
MCVEAQRRVASLTLESEPRQDSGRRVRQPGKRFDINKLAPHDRRLKPLGLDDHGRGLADKGALRFREAGRAAEVIGERHAQVAITPRVGGSAVDTGK